MSVWKTIREREPIPWSNAIVLTKHGEIKCGFWNLEDRIFMVKGRLARKINYKRYCYENELVNQIEEELKTKS